MAKLPFFALLRIVFDARNETHALATAEYFKSRVEEFLEEGDEATLLQTSQFAQYEQPEKEIHLLRQARNVLLRMQYSDCHATAQFLDRISWFMETGQLSSDSRDYDWNRIERVAQQVLKGGNPLD